MLLPSDLENPSESLGLKGVYSRFLCLGELPSLKSMQQYGQDQAREEETLVFLLMSLAFKMKDVPTIAILLLMSAVLPPSMGTLALRSWLPS